MSERGVWVMRGGELIPRHLAPPLHPKHAEAPGLIRDGLDYVWNPVDGKRYDSKAAYYKAVRRAGCEIVGNEKPSASTRPYKEITGEEIARSIERAVARRPAVRRKRKVRT